MVYDYYLVAIPLEHLLQTRFGSSGASRCPTSGHFAPPLSTDGRSPERGCFGAGLSKCRNSARALIAVANPSPSRVTFVSGLKSPSRTIFSISLPVSAVRLWPSSRYIISAGTPRLDATGVNSVANPKVVHLSRGRGRISVCLRPSCPPSGDRSRHSSARRGRSLLREPRDHSWRSPAISARRHPKPVSHIAPSRTHKGLQLKPGGFERLVTSAGRESCFQRRHRRVSASQESEHCDQPNDDCSRTDGASDQQSPASLTMTAFVQGPHQPLEARFRVEANRRILHAENTTELDPIYQNRVRVLRSEAPHFFHLSIHWTLPVFTSRRKPQRVLECRLSIEAPDLPAAGQLQLVPRRSCKSWCGLACPSVPLSTLSGRGSPRPARASYRRSRPATPRHPEVVHAATPMSSPLRDPCIGVVAFVFHFAPTEMHRSPLLRCPSNLVRARNVRAANGFDQYMMKSSDFGVDVASGLNRTSEGHLRLVV